MKEEGPPLQAWVAMWPRHGEAGSVHVRVCACSLSGHGVGCLGCREPVSAGCSGVGRGGTVPDSLLAGMCLALAPRPQSLSPDWFEGDSGWPQPQPPSRVPQGLH